MWWVVAVVCKVIIFGLFYFLIRYFITCFLTVIFSVKYYNGEERRAVYYIRSFTVQYIFDEELIDYYLGNKKS